MADDVPEPTKAESAAIRSIKEDDVHKICSGQVILTLAVAVKELVENAIDAKAKNIEVKLRDKGLEGLEICDDGCGVKPNDLESMTAKYHTSKIEKFQDLQSVETFGFRGEALSSLCALTEMSIITRHRDCNEAIKIVLDHKGKIISRSCHTRAQGTTVLLTNLFVTLPVRRRDFERNIKKEFAKMCHILQAYCLVSKGIRIRCTNQTSNGASSLVMMTQGREDVLSNIYAIFGRPKLGEIIKLESPFKDSKGDVLTQDELISALQTNTGDNVNITKDDLFLLYNTEFALEGYISSCAHGSGRSSKDRQFFYVNSRPCDLKNISKAVNDCYHSFNNSQYPFVYLNIIICRQEVDVNLTPDKRQIMLINEKLLLILLKRALHLTFDQIPATYKVQNVSISDIQTKINNTDLESIDLIPLSTAEKFRNVLSQWKRTGDTAGKAPNVPAKRKGSDEIIARTLKMQKIHKFLNNEDIKLSGQYDYKSDPDTDGEVDKTIPIDRSQLKQESKTFDELVERIDCKSLTPQKSACNFVSLSNSSKNIVNNLVSIDENTDPPAIVELDISDTETKEHSNICSQFFVTLKEIEDNLKADEILKADNENKAKLERLRFKSEITPSQNKSAEDELQKEISKSSFAHMEVIGQFNLGFIICKLDTDLFIIDQHATDEKYNYETLRRTTQLQYQTLAIPQALELTGVNEMILMENLPIFEKNGFKFNINSNASPTKKVSLLGKPFSKNWEFGKEDIDELIFMLQDAPEGTICRPSRINAMFASRACRTSVMIGTHLKKSKMKQLIEHMGEMEQPWNCPHGRPTMRHLINIAMLLNTETNEND
uniref:MutL C-terminal dimerisation domain-containing protein n=1 Tax=Glossina brevipalpis TaxID=37001 RepID=A0A1A9WWK9_9MUSC